MGFVPEYPSPLQCWQMHIVEASNGLFGCWRSVAADEEAKEDIVVNKRWEAPLLIGVV